MVLGGALGFLIKWLEHQDALCQTETLRWVAVGAMRSGLRAPAWPRPCAKLTPSGGLGGGYADYGLEGQQEESAEERCGQYDPPDCDRAQGQSSVADLVQALEVKKTSWSRLLVSLRGQNLCRMADVEQQDGKAARSTLPAACPLPPPGKMRPPTHPPVDGCLVTPPHPTPWGTVRRS